MASPTFTVNGSAVNGAAVVAYGSTVTVALVSTLGVKSVVWSTLSTSHADTSAPSFTPAGSPSGATATFAFRANPGDAAGRALRVQGTVIDANGVASSMSAIVGVAGTSGIVPFCPGEETERGTPGWTTDLNAAIEGMGNGGAGLKGWLDVTKSPYNAVAGDRSAAAANTVAIMAAITDAAGSGMAVYLPGGVYHVAKGAGGADSNGWTCALALPDVPITIIGQGAQSTFIKYCTTGGVYSALLHNPETADINTETYRAECRIEGVEFDCGDNVSNLGCPFGLKVRKWLSGKIRDVRVVEARAAGICWDWCFTSQIDNCDCSYNRGHGIAGGAYDYNLNTCQVTGTSCSWNGGVGIYYGKAVQGLIQSCTLHNNAVAGIVVRESASVTIDSCYFEGQCNGAGPSGATNYPATGLHFSNDVPNPRPTDIFFFRGDIDATDPTAWVWTLGPTSGGDYFDPLLNNPGCIVRGCYSANYISQGTFVGSNAAEGLLIDSCESLGGTRKGLYGQYGDGYGGYAMRFEARNCHGFLDPSLYLFGWGGTLRDFGQTRTSGVSRRNLLGHDVIAECMSRLPNAAAGYLTGELTLSTSVTYHGKPVYRLSGESSFAAKGIPIDVTANPELANKIVVIGGMFYTPALSGIWPTACPMLASYNGSTPTDPHLTSRPYATGWTYRSLAYQLPASGTVYLGFAGAFGAGGEAFLADPAIHELGAPYDEVVAGNVQGGWRCALNLQLDKAGNEAKSFGANGVTTVAGVACTVAGYAAASPAMSVQADGSGLSIAPINTSGFASGSITAPRLEFKFADFIPGYHPGMKVRVWAANPTNNSAADWDAAFVGIWDGGDFSASASGGFISCRGRATAANGFRTLWYNAGTTLHSTSQNVALAASNNVSLLLCDDIGHSTPQQLVGQMGTAWPAALTVEAGNNTPTGIRGLTSANARVCIGAQRGGSGTALVCKFTNLRIDYQP